MADIVLSTPVEGIGGTVLKAAGLVAATAGHTAISMGRSAFDVQINVTACEIASGDEFYNITVEANTIAAPTVWTTIGQLLVCGASAKVASQGDAPQTAFSVKAGFKNYGDYQVRLKTWASGTIATGINFSAKAYPSDNINY